MADPGGSSPTPNFKAGRLRVLEAYAHFLETLAIRRSSLLFRLLAAADDVQGRLRFYNTGPNQAPGLIVMTLADDTGAVDPAHKRVVVVFNGTRPLASRTSRAST